MSLGILEPSLSFPAQRRDCGVGEAAHGDWGTLRGPGDITGLCSKGMPSSDMPLCCIALGPEQLGGGTCFYPLLCLDPPCTHPSSWAGDNGQGVTHPVLEGKLAWSSHGWRDVGLSPPQVPPPTAIPAGNNSGDSRSQSRGLLVSWGAGGEGGCPGLSFGHTVLGGGKRGEPGRFPVAASVSSSWWRWWPGEGTEEGAGCGRNPPRTCLCIHTHTHICW